MWSASGTITTGDTISQDLHHDLLNDFLIPDMGYEGGFNKVRTPACAVVGSEADPHLRILAK